MTKEEILAMEVGTELDALVAEKVMGHPMPDFIPENALDLYLAGAPIHYDSWTCVCRYDEGDVPKWVPDPYSTDISAAWQVRQRIFDTMGKQLHLHQSLNNIWWAKFRLTEIFASSKEAPEAICKASLLTKLEEADK